ncbi:Vps52p KNAG_0K02110 [Huiozyma naganishii CBS 8797]|uniref:Vacuolar protein sorting-associated protein 52 n=1 Tax=Huiozyma naganishii (strain ATCC MYA-139 / BCRC 22969 / CBS 8797 / KCTC 17520 / NBRC 10181 / NCYC 3082 / Yp74L-3) TaxID=1071383 RepID=J7SAA0_HUIN7|nr:hypothetical protein KNAG_0K02110 [Kazachstania naganishii CBS 8797]CCK72574.1 hypothetical protein KNAG_0K02110 [Kazachstania naganishii CBS 8797]
MEVLHEILGIDPKGFPSDVKQGDTEAQTNSEQNDMFQLFLEEHSEFERENPDFSDTKQLDDTLKSLETKRDNLQNSLENIIPPLMDYLTNFNEKLSKYTSELGFIKQKSEELKSVSEYNSKKLSGISPLVNDLLIPPPVIHEILTGKINSQWIDNITFIRDKQEMYSKYKNSKEKVALPKDFDSLCNVVDVLNTVIIERSKKYIVSRIRILRSGKPGPSQRLQNQLIKLKELFKFIIENNYSLALEIRQAYAYTMRWYYREYFKRYIRSLTILQFNPVDSRYSLGNTVLNENTDNTTSSLFTSYLSPSYGYSSAATNETVKSYFQVTKRLSILTQEDNTVMVSQIAETNNNTKSNYIEIGFKNLNLALLDNCTVEYHFLKEFFKVSEDDSEIDGLLEQIISPTWEECLRYTEDVLINPSVYDILGVLISIRIANQLQIEALRRRIPVIDSYLNDQLFQLWPKFQQLVDWQSDSLNSINLSKLDFTKERNLTSPHALTISFTVFLQSLLFLGIQPAPPDVEVEAIDERSEPLYNSITRLRNDYENTMTKISKLTKAPEKFLSINYLYVYNSLQQQSLTLNDAEKDGGQFTMRENEGHFKALVEAYNQQR